MAGDVGGRSCTDSELLLHPELLSQEFLLLTLEQVGRAEAGGPVWERGSDLSRPQVILSGSGHTRRRRLSRLVCVSVHSTPTYQVSPRPCPGKRRP